MGELIKRVLTARLFTKLNTHGNIKILVLKISTKYRLYKGMWIYIVLQLKNMPYIFFFIILFQYIL